jgi:hypothetical protein
MRIRAHGPRYTEVEIPVYKSPHYVGGSLGDFAAGDPYSETVEHQRLYQRQYRAQHKPTSEGKTPAITLPRVKFLERTTP